MTIYTPPQNDKDKAKLLTDDCGVVDGSMTSLDMREEQDSPGPRVVEVTFLRRNLRSSFFVHLLFALAVLVILACGALGAVVFYRHLHKKHVYSGRCGTEYFDVTYHNGVKGPFPERMLGQNRSGIMRQRDPYMGARRPTNVQMDIVQEDIVVIEEEMFEELHTPAFDEVRESYVRHDFMLNFTAIVDHRFEQCFVMKLNRSAIAPPRNLIELLHLTLMAKTYLERASVIRQDFEAAYMMEDLSHLGRRIAKDCASYPTHWLEKRVSGVYKRSVEAVTEQTAAYAMMSNQIDQQVIYKIFINYQQVKRDDGKVASAA